MQWMLSMFRPARACHVLIALIWVALPTASSLAEEARISDIRVVGNHAVQADAVRGLLQSRIGGTFSPKDVRTDIKAIYKSGFFQDVGVEREDQSDGSVVLVVTVVEKPIISNILFEGFREVTSSTIGDKLQTKRYTIVDEKKLADDVRVLEQMYIEKGYYLAKVSYELKSAATGEVELVFTVVENNPVSVGRISIIGNGHFSDSEIKNGLLTSEKRWGSWLSNTGIFRDEVLNRDKEYMTFLYRDNGFIESEISTPQSWLNAGRQKIDISFAVEEGEQYYVGAIRFTGDILFSPGQFDEKLQLKEKKLFRVSQFRNDIQTLTDMYGDQGYAFVDVLPKTVTNRDKRTVDLEWEIKKGEKAYFRRITVEGNSKTRDNVIRRNLKVAEGERFHSTRLEKSREAITRLGFFEDVQIQREPDAKNRAVDLRVKVKEKATGSLNASIGASPTQQGDINFMGQGSYSEANFLGYGWEANLSANVTRNETTDHPNWGVSLSFTEPSINDGPWSITTYLKFDYEYQKPFKNEPEIATQKKRGGVSVGRELIEDLRLSLGYSYERVQTNDLYPVYAFLQVGDTERFSQTLTYDKTNNFRMPTDGYYLSAGNIFAMPIFGSDYWFGKSDFSAVYYFPINYTDDFLTNFRFAFEPGFVYPLGGHRIPVWERLRLGSTYNMRGYQSKPITPSRTFIDTPWRGSLDSQAVGGVTRLYGAAEYFVPLIPEANLRMVGFWEAGTILDEGQDFSSDLLKYDVGVGIRWTTPIAPFRFEWAWPVKDGRLGTGDFIFTIGQDNASAF
jgi:outer membrane protein insertion porin family